MIAIENLSDQEFEGIAFDILSRELGADGLARFLTMHRSGSGDYTKERENWQRGISVDDIAASMRLRRENK